MRDSTRHPRALFVIALAMLSLRALTPDGYMPGSRGSGLLFELCPSGMPVEIMRALGGGHHHPHGDSKSPSGTEQCPIGHMLSSAAAVDSDVVVELQAAMPWFEVEIAGTPSVPRLSAYRSRAPPA